jgi:hypothetical protein
MLMASKKRKVSSAVALTAQVKKTEKAILQRLEMKASRNAKNGTKQFFIDEGTKKLVHAVAVATHSDVAPSVQRNEVCRKATNYRADLAILARIRSWQANGIISDKIGIMWAVKAPYALQNPFSELSEKVFIVRKH